jgi:hypothetical protein
MSNPIDVMIIGATPEMIHNWGWFLAFGIVLLLLGIIAVARAFSATVVSMVFFGWLLVFSGTIEFVDAFMVGQWAGFFLHILASIPWLGALSGDQLHVDPPARLGMACPEWRPYDRSRWPRPGRMAGNRALGDRPLRWD